MSHALSCWLLWTLSYIPTTMHVMSITTMPVSVTTPRAMIITSPMPSIITPPMAMFLLSRFHDNSSHHSHHGPITVTIMLSSQRLWDASAWFPSSFSCSHHQQAHHYKVMKHKSFLRKTPMHDSRGHESIYKNLFSHHGMSFMSQGSCHLNMLQLMQTSAHDSNEMPTYGTPCL